MILMQLQLTMMLALALERWSGAPCTNAHAKKSTQHPPVLPNLICAKFCWIGTQKNGSRRKETTILVHTCNVRAIEHFEYNPRLMYSLRNGSFSGSRRTDCKSIFREFLGILYSSTRNRFETSDLVVWPSTPQGNGGLADFWHRTHRPIRVVLNTDLRRTDVASQLASRT